MRDLTGLAEGGTITLASTRFGRLDPEEWLAFQVEDDDVGMTSEQLDKLSVRMTQADASTTREFGGIGLSLALTKAPSTMLGGDVAVESRPGKPQHLHAEAASRVQGWYAGGCIDTARLPEPQIRSGSHRPA